MKSATGFHTHVYPHPPAHVHTQITLPPHTHTQRFELGSGVLFLLDGGRTCLTIQLAEAVRLRDCVSSITETLAQMAWFSSPLPALLLWKVGMGQ